MNSNMKTFSQMSPQRRLLSFQEYTPAKAIVGNDINGWLQTHKKPLIQEIKKPPKCLHIRYNAQKKDKQILIPFRKISNLQTINLLSITKLKPELQGFSTNCRTSDIKSSADKKEKSIIKHEISQFDITDLEVNHQQMNLSKKFNSKQQNILRIRQMPTDLINRNHNNLLTDRADQRKKHMSKLLSYNKLKKISKNQPLSLNNPSSFSRKLSLINRSQQIVKGNLTANQRQALNMILKKSENIEPIMNMNMGGITNNNKLKNHQIRNSVMFNLKKENRITSYKFFSNQGEN